MPPTRTFARWLIPAAGCVAVACALTACGSGSSSGGKRSEDGQGKQAQQSQQSQQAIDADNGNGGTRGGTLQIVSQQDVNSLDPGSAYSGVDLSFLTVTQRTLYAYEPNKPSVAVPDLAAGPPQIGDGGRTMTVKIRPGVHYAPPVNREVRSGDIKYAIERGFNPHVANVYAGTYYGSIVGADKARGGPISGITTPDAHTIRFRFTTPVASLVQQAMILPLDAPVPPEYAKPFDAKAPSTYGAHQVATGPYMLAADAKGKVLGTGYQPGKQLRLVRNPNWKADTDFRPAYVDGVDWSIGANPTVGARQVLQGSHMYFLDAPSGPTVKLAYQKYRNQIYFSPGAGSRYVALNTSKAPFDNADLRRAVAAALDRDQMRLVRGGAFVGDIATHFLYPGVNGFEDAGGKAGFGFDFLAHPAGDMALAQKYLRAAGYPSGRYTGNATLLVAGATGSPDDLDAQIVERALQSLGFRTKLRLLDQSAMFETYCATPRSGYDVCTNLGWVRDFADPQTVLDVAFNGNAISPQGNSNWPQLNDPKINDAMAKAELTVGETQRARAWAAIDRMITGTAAAIPWLWDNQPVIFSRDTQCVNAQWNQGYCDFAFSSLK
jgi:peptide/nickel transport system substrate-binding protein